MPLQVADAVGLGGRGNAEGGGGDGNAASGEAVQPGGHRSMPITPGPGSWYGSGPASMTGLTPLAVRHGSSGSGGGPGRRGRLVDEPDLVSDTLTVCPLGVVYVSPPVSGRVPPITPPTGLTRRAVDRSGSLRPGITPPEGR